MSTLRPFRPAHVPGPPRVVPRRALAHDREPASAATDPVLAAEAEAAAILIAAEAERDRMSAEGFAQGMERANATLASERAALAGSLDAIADAHAAMAEQMAESAAHLAVEIAMDLVGDAIAITPDVLAPIAQRALATAPIGAQRVRMHPACADVIGTSLEIDVIADPSLCPGDVIVETTAGEIDHRLAVSRDLLHDAVRAARPPAA